MVEAQSKDSSCLKGFILDGASVMIFPDFVSSPCLVYCQRNVIALLSISISLQIVCSQSCSSSSPGHRFRKPLQGSTVHMGQEARRPQKSTPHDTPNARMFQKRVLVQPSCRPAASSSSQSTMNQFITFVIGLHHNSNRNASLSDS